MKIISGKIRKYQKVTVYGPEGIGKSTFASRFPRPLFIDTEGSTAHLDVDRLERPSSWVMLMQYIDALKKDNQGYQTLVIDTVDWAEHLCVEYICHKYQHNGIEDFGYGKGYMYEKEEFGRLLNRLQDLVDTRMNVVLTAHAMVRKFERPDQPPYDRYELKLNKAGAQKISDMVKEWADMLLFANYKEEVYKVDSKDNGPICCSLPITKRRYIRSIPRTAAVRKQRSLAASVSCTRVTTRTGTPRTGTAWQNACPLSLRRLPIVFRVRNQLNRRNRRHLFRNLYRKNRLRHRLLRLPHWIRQRIYQSICWICTT